MALQKMTNSIEFRVDGDAEFAFFDNVCVEGAASTIKTPFYLYSANRIRENFKNLQNAFAKINPLIAFAIKASPNVEVVRLMAQMGCGADCVSVGEMMRANAAGVPFDKIVFSGVGKTDEELEYAILNSIKQINVESKEEILIIDEICQKLNRKINVALRINPDVNAQTHSHITTGRKCDKFGIDIDDVEDALSVVNSCKGVVLYGLSVHIGSQITSAQPFELAFDKFIKFAKKLKADGYNIKSIDFGGGLGVKYAKDQECLTVQEYADIIIKCTQDCAKDFKFVIEPGRVLVANAGIIVTKVILEKRTHGTNFLIVDAAMNDIMRPCLYQAFHEIVPALTKKTSVTKSLETYEIVGPVCESTDKLGTKRKLPRTNRGNILMILDAGAYGASMSSTYNTRPLIPEYLIEAEEGGESSIVCIRKRPEYKEFIFN